MISSHLAENLVPFDAEPDEDVTYTLLIDPWAISVKQTTWIQESFQTHPSNLVEMFNPLKSRKESCSPNNKTYLNPKQRNLKIS